MKGIITLAFAGFISLVNSQTPLISHKSHSGSLVTYFIDPLSNFGAIKLDFEMSQPAKLYRNESFIPLNDSTMILEIRDLEQKVIQTDTLPNKERQAPYLFQSRYQDSIRKREQEEEYKLKIEKEEQLRKQELESQQQLIEPVPAKKKKKSYLLFLFGITGGGMLLMRLFRQSKSVQQIA
ncbi:hypothetical protein D3C87_34360 [compost metagenome]